MCVHVFALVVCVECVYVFVECTGYFKMRFLLQFHNTLDCLCLCNFVRGLNELSVLTSMCDLCVLTIDMCVDIYVC